MVILEPSRLFVSKHPVNKNIDKILKQSKIKYEVFSKNVSMNQHKILINKIKECLNEQ